MPGTHESLASAIEGLAVHDHLCLIYESREEQFAAVVPFVRHGLAAGQRCVYVADDNTADAVRGALRSDGIDVDAESARGALQILTKRESYLCNGGFDPDGMIAFLAEATAAAKADGFSALRVTGEMTWVLGGEPGTERLFDYEAKLNYFFPDHDALAICQYNRSRFEADVVLNVIRTHPLVISGHLVCANFHYVPPDDFLQPNQPGREVDRLLSSIIEAERSRQALGQASRDWSATFDAMNDMVFLLAQDGTVLRCNRSMVNLLGLGMDEVIGKKCYELMHGLSTFIEKCPYQNMLRTRKREGFELSLGEHCYQVTADPLFGEAEEIVGAVHVVRDITETKKAREALAEKSRWLMAINGLALDLASLAPDANLGDLLTRRLRETTDAAAVSFGPYDRQDKVIGPTQLSFAPGVLELIAPPLRKRLSDLRSPVDDDLYLEIVATGVGGLASLAEATSGAISPAMSSALQKLSGVDRFVAVAYVVEGELYGSSLLALRGGAPDPPRELLEAFASMAAVSLRRLRAERELLAKTEELDRFFALSGDLLGIVDTDGIIQRVNPAWESTLGCAIADIEGRRMLDFLHPDDCERTLAAIADKAEGHRVIGLTNRQRRRDGSYRLVEWRVTPYEGRLLFSVGRDITEKVEAQAREEARLRREADQARLLLGLYAAAPRLSDKELYDRALDEAVALTDSSIGFFHLVSDDEQNIVLTTWNLKALEGCTAPQGGHYPLARAGNWVDCVRLKRPVFYNDYETSPNRKGLPEGHSPVHRFLSVPVVAAGRVRAVFGVGNKLADYDESDVMQIQLVASELHKIMEMRGAEAEIRALNASLERRVQKRTRELAATNRELQEFVYSVSHDLRSPLRAVDGFSLAVLEDYGDVIDEQGRGDLRRVRAAAQRMGELIDALLMLSRLGRREIDLEQVDLSAIARRVIAELREAEPERQVDVVIGDGLVAEADMALVDVVLENLLGNAWKFTAMRPSAHIELGSTQRDGQLAFFVRDDGAGFDPTYVDKLFTPFQRLHSTEQFPGTGIGLATVARVLGRLGGTCWAEGEVDRGATFFFTLSGGSGHGGGGLPPQGAPSNDPDLSRAVE